MRSQRSHAGVGYRVKRSMLLVSWHRQRLVENILFDLPYMLRQKLTTMQHEIAELLVLKAGSLQLAGTNRSDFSKSYITS